MGDGASEGTPVWGVSAALLRTVLAGDGGSLRGALGSPSWCVCGVLDQTRLGCHPGGPWGERARLLGTRQRRWVTAVVFLAGSSVMFYLAAAVSDFYIPTSEMPEHKIQSSEGPLQVRPPWAWPPSAAPSSPPSTLAVAAAWRLAVNKTWERLQSNGSLAKKACAFSGNGRVRFHGSRIPWKYPFKAVRAYSVEMSRWWISRS